MKTHIHYTVTDFYYTRKTNVYDMFSTVMWYNFKEVVVQYKMVSAEFLNTFDRHKSVTRSERDFCGSRVFYKVNILKIGT